MLKNSPTDLLSVVLKKASSFVNPPTQTGIVQASWSDPDGPVVTTEAVIEGRWSVMVRRERDFMEANGKGCGEMFIGGGSCFTKIASRLFA